MPLHFIFGASGGASVEAVFSAGTGTVYHADAERTCNDAPQKGNPEH